MPGKRKAVGKASAPGQVKPRRVAPGEARMQMGRAAAPRATGKGIAKGATAIGRKSTARPATAKSVARPENPVAAAGRAIGDAAAAAGRGLQSIAASVIPGSQRAQTTNTISNAMRGAPAARKALKRR